VGARKPWNAWKHPALLATETRQVAANDARSRVEERAEAAGRRRRPEEEEHESPRLIVNKVNADGYRRTGGGRALRGRDRGHEAGVGGKGWASALSSRTPCDRIHECSAVDAFDARGASQVHLGVVGGEAVTRYVSQCHPRHNRHADDIMRWQAGIPRGFPQDTEGGTAPTHGTRRPERVSESRSNK